MQQKAWIVGAVAALVVLVATGLILPLASSLEKSAVDLVASAWAEERWQQELVLHVGPQNPSGYLYCGGQSVSRRYGPARTQVLPFGHLSVLTLTEATERRQQ